MANTAPAALPRVPHVSAGSCAKYPGWFLKALVDAALTGPAGNPSPVGREGKTRHSSAKGAGNPSPVRRGAGERCRPLDQRTAEPTAGGGEGSLHAENGRHLTLPSPYRRGFCRVVPVPAGRRGEPFSRMGEGQG
jgi:hypothetical protein